MFPKDGPAPGLVRIFTDHTGRWYEDITEEEYVKRIEEFNNDELCKFMQDEINKEILGETK